MILFYLQKKAPLNKWSIIVIKILKQVQYDVNVIPVQDYINVIPVQDYINVIPVQDDVNVIPNLFRNLFILVLNYEAAKGLNSNCNCKLSVVSLFIR